MVTNDLLYKSEMLILSLIQNQELEFEQIRTQLLQYTFDMKQGILFTFLYHLENAQLISHRATDKHDYYQIAEAGRIRLNTLTRQYQDLQGHISDLMRDNQYE